MGALLTPLVEQWLYGIDAMDIRDAASIVLLGAEIRRRGAANGLEAVAVESLANAASELAHNQLRHARGGWAGVRDVRRGDVRGVEVVAADSGPGIGDPTAALRGGGPRTAGLGVGLAAAIRLVDEADIDVRAGEGTAAWVRKFAAPVRRSEMAIVGRPCAGERISGDQAFFRRGDDGLLAAVVDGIGHGEPARHASDLAVAVMARRSAEAPDALLAACDGALAGSRGAVIAAARLALGTGDLVHASAGNIGTRVYQRDGAVRTLAGSARTLGGNQRGGRIATEQLSGAPYQTLVMYSDGISSRFAPSDAAALLREPALVIAHHILAQYARDDDDALVLVVR